MSQSSPPRIGRARALRLASAAACLTAVAIACERSSKTKNDTPGSGGAAGQQTASGGAAGQQTTSGGAAGAPRDASNDAPANPKPDASGGAPNQPQGKRCIVHLHGKSGGGGPPSQSGDVTHLRPQGNAEGWGGYQWLYFPDSSYNQVRSIVANAISGASCGAVIVHGFSNGGAAAAKFYCRGETFGGKMVGFIADDPVPDHAVENCRPAAGVKIRVYWTGNLAYAGNGWDCGSADWTCEGNTTIGIDRYVQAIGTTATRSIHTDHREYESPPEYTSWW
ncbi:MAG TPA: hypothetical protein VI072_20715 [Polyangiaceae bacterium]